MEKKEVSLVSYLQDSLMRSVVTAATDHQTNANYGRLLNNLHNFAHGNEVGIYIIIPMLSIVIVTIHEK